MSDNEVRFRFSNGGMIQLAHWLRSHRFACGLTQQDVADSTGWSQSRVSQYEWCDITPRPTQVKQWGDALDVDIYIVIVPRKPDAKPDA